MSQSWKKSGGLKQFDAMNHITVNSITTDDFAMRTPYKGTFTISGELYVFDDASFNKNVKIGGNEFVEKNIYLRQKLIMGKEWERTDGERIDSYRNFFISDQSGVGLNIENPTATLDISGSGQRILHVYSSADKTSNILARNKNQHRIALEVDNSNTQVVFTHSDVSSEIIFEPTTEQIRFPEQVAITSVLKPSRASLVITSKPMNTKPFLDYIYDVSSNISAPLHVHSLDVSGTAMAFFSNERDKGWYYGGGNYPKDPSRQMGLMGWQDPSGTFLPSQIQVNGQNLRRNRITTGINTYMPITEEYVLDINGPLKIHHQEIREALKTDFTVHSVSFSKENPLFGLAVGKEKNIRNNISYNTVLRTRDSGITWDSLDISFIKVSNQSQETTLGVFAFDMSNAVIVSKGANALHIFRTNSQGAVWIENVSGSFFANNSTATTLKPYAIDFSNILLGETDISCNEIKVFSYSSLPVKVVMGTMNPNRQITSMDAHMDLSGNTTIYTADTSGCIDKYTYTRNTNNTIITDISYTFTYVSNQHQKNGIPYLFVAHSEDNYTFACGHNIVSVKKSTDISFTDISFDHGIVFNHAVIRDLSYAMVVGNAGIIYVARGDIRVKSNWFRMTEEMVKGMGNAEVIVKSTRHLKHVHSMDLSCHFLFTYALENGLESRMVHGYLPDIWFPESSPPLISIDGHIETTRQSINIFENKVETIHIGRYAKDTFMDMCGNVHVNTSFHNKINSDNLHIQSGGKGIFWDDISSSGPILSKNYVSPTVNTALYDISNTLSLNGTIWIKGNLVVDGSTNILNDSFNVNTGQSKDLSGTLQSRMYVNYLDQDTTHYDNHFKGSGFYIYNDRPTDSTGGTANYCIEHEGFMKVSNEECDKLSFRSIGHQNVVAFDFPNIQTYTPQFNTLLVLHQHNIPNALSDVSDNFYIRSSHCDNTTIDVSARMLNIFDLSVNKDVDIFGKEFVAGDVRFGSNFFLKGNFETTGNVVLQSDISVSGNTTNYGQIFLKKSSVGTDSKIQFHSRTKDADYATIQYFDSTTDKPFLYYGSDFSGSNNHSCLAITTNGDGLGVNGDNILIRPAARLVLDTGVYTDDAVPSRTNRPGGDIIILPNGGRLGIGTNNPKTDLDVSGDISFNGKFYVRDNIGFGMQPSVNHKFSVTGGDVSFSDNLYVGGNATIRGNFTVQGTTTTIHSTVQTIKDPVIVLGEDVSSGWSSDEFDRGIIFKFDNSYGFMGYDRSMSTFRFVNHLTTDVSSNQVQHTDYSKEGTLFAKSYTCSDNSGIAQIILHGSNTDMSYSQWNGITTRNSGQVYNIADDTLKHVFMYGCEKVTNTNEISGGVIVTEIAKTGVTIYGNLYARNDVSFNSKLFVGGDVSLNSKLYVVGDVSLNSKLSVGGDVSLNSKLYVGGDVSFNSKLFVGEDVSFNSTLNVTGKSNLSLLSLSRDEMINEVIFNVSNKSGSTISFAPSVGNGGYNPQSVSGDQCIYASGVGGTNTGILNLTTHANVYACGIRISSTDTCLNGNIYLNGPIKVKSGYRLEGYALSSEIPSLTGYALSSEIPSLTDYAPLESPVFTTKISVGGNAVLGAKFAYLVNMHATPNTATNASTAMVADTASGCKLSGTMVAASFNATSDYRMKENIEKLPISDCSVDNLNPVSYILKQNKEPHLGFLAHELQEHFPTAVTGKKDGETMQTVNYMELVPVLVKEIQHLKKEVTLLKKDVQYLKQELSSLT